MEPDEVDAETRAYGGLVMEALKFAWGVGDATPEDLVRRFDLTKADAETVADFVANLRLRNPFAGTDIGLVHFAEFVDVPQTGGRFGIRFPRVGSSSEDEQPRVAARR